MSGLAIDRLSVRQGSFSLGPIGVSVEPGEAVALVGPSGAGKTTLLRAVCGFVPVVDGSVSLRGRELGALPPEDRGIGYVPQGLGLLPHRSVRRNVRYPLEVRGTEGADRRVDELLAEWGLERLGRSDPASVSGGEQQRVAMARALAAEPDALLWDEPLSALDPVSRDALIEVTTSALARHSLPLLIVTHDAETAFSVAERFVVLDGGRVAFSGGAAALLDRPPNAFSARFVGFENVFDRPDSELLRTAWGAGGGRIPVGSEGICFRATAVQVSGSGPGPAGRVRRIRRSPRGTRVWVELSHVPRPLVADLGGYAEGRLAAGDLVRLELDVDRVDPLGRLEETTAR